MPSPIVRSACDRCHDQKLRCNRAASGGACVRCTRAKVSCIWTPSARRTREPRRSTVNTAILPAGAAVVDVLMPTAYESTAIDPIQTSVAFDPSPDMFQGMPTVWSDSTTFLNSATDTSASPDLTGSAASHAIATRNHPSPQTTNTSNEEALNSWQYRFNEEWTMLSADREIGRDDAFPQVDFPASDASQPSGPRNLPVDTIRRLTDLHVELFALATQIPKPPTTLSQPLSWKEKDVAIDKTFQLSHAFIEAIDNLDPHQSQDSLDLGAWCTTGPQAAPTNDAPVDQASLLLVLSCYQRLIETYDDIFGNVQACLDRFSITAREDYVKMPDVKVGSFSLPHSSALQITLVLQLARHLLRRIGSMVMNLNQRHVPTNALMDNLTSITAQTVSSRETELIKRIATLRNTLSNGLTLLMAQRTPTTFARSPVPDAELGSIHPKKLVVFNTLKLMDPKTQTGDAQQHLQFTKPLSRTPRMSHDASRHYVLLL
ncbi:hypothetical protein F5Y14DRAFT_452171 [Nemania sp. NC0429]|nr:hypothetical protein F5Y14DRAFT_452171 [Nemania sp. NC0429]